MFVKVMRKTTHSGEEKLAETIINTANVNVVKEHFNAPITQDLYNEDGELVETKVVEEGGTEYHVYQTQGPRITLDKENYELLAQALLK